MSHVKLMPAISGVMLPYQPGSAGGEQRGRCGEITDVRKSRKGLCMSRKARLNDCDLSDDATSFSQSRVDEKLMLEIEQALYVCMKPRLVKWEWLIGLR